MSRCYVEGLGRGPVLVVKNFHPERVLVRGTRSPAHGAARTGHQPPLRANSPTTPMPTATVPKVSCKMLKPRSGICTSSSIANSALASRTASDAQGERRNASQAAKPDGTATVMNSHPAGSTQLDSPIGLSTETGGVAAPARS